MNDTLKYFLRFLLFLAVQLVFFNSLNLGTYLFPAPYILFLLLFPCLYSVAWLLIWAFAFGLCLDVFGGGVLGLHTSALLILALFRYGLLRLVSVKGDLDNLSVPGFVMFGFGRYFVFVLLSVLAHHIVYFSLESFSFFHFWQVFLRIAGSTLLNVFLVLLFERVFYAGRR